MQKRLRIKDKVDTTPVDARIRNTKSCNSTVRPLCSLSLYVLCLVFVRACFLVNPKKKQGNVSLTEPSIHGSK